MFDLSRENFFFLSCDNIWAVYDTPRCILERTLFLDTDCVFVSFFVWLLTLS